MALTLDQVGKVLDLEWPASSQPGSVRDPDAGWDWQPDAIQYIYNLFMLLTSDQGKLGPRPTAGRSLASFRDRLSEFFEYETGFDQEAYEEIIKEVTNPQDVYDRIVKYLLGGVADNIEQSLVSRFEDSHKTRSSVKVTLWVLLQILSGDMIDFLFSDWLPPDLLHYGYEPETPFQKQLYARVDESFKATFPGYHLDPEAHLTLYHVLRHLMHVFGLWTDLGRNEGPSSKYDKEQVIEWLKGLGAPMTSDDPSEQMIRSVLGIIFGAFAQLGSTTMTYNHTLRAIMANPWFDLVPYLRANALD